MPDPPPPCTALNLQRDKGCWLKMAVKLKEEQIAEFQECWSMFDRDGEGITICELQSVMRALGHQPTQTRLVDLISGITDPEVGSGLIDFNEFLTVMLRKISQDVPYHAEMLDAFSAEIFLSLGKYLFVRLS